MEHIERMKQEHVELQDKYNKGCDFLEQETREPKFTDEIQRRDLSIQLNLMWMCKQLLMQRIIYDENK